MTTNATYSFEDNKLRLYASERLDAETYKQVRAFGFIWAPKQQLFVAPMWTPSRESFLIELAGSIENEDTTLEQRTLERAERFEKYSENRAKDSEQRANAADSMSEAFTMGQPILVGHHSERKARKLAQKIENNMRASIKFYEQAEYWKDRASGSLHAAARKERPDVRTRRIKKLEAEKRKYQKDIDRAQDFIKLWSREPMTLELAENIAGLDRMRLKMTDIPPLYEGHDGFFSVYDLIRRELFTFDLIARIKAAHERGAAYASRWTEHIQRRIDYETEMLKASGHQVPDYKALAAAKRAKTTALPIVNCPGDGILEITKEQWSKVPSDYKGVRPSACGKYRYRKAFERFCGVQNAGYSYIQVFIKDQKIVNIPNEESQEVSA